MAPPTRAYRARVLLVLLALLTFLLIYLALVAASGYLIWLAATMEPERGKGAFLQILLVLGTVMLFAYFFKGLFRRSGDPAKGSLLLTEEAQPALFAFVRRLCKESGTPFPGGIHLTHDLNASVFYPQSLLNLVRPTRKRLQIGLSLVNAVDLSEFKAVLAHEFGHFAQSSMKLGQYVYEAHKVLHALVYGRDAWDDLLARWRGIDLRLSFPAWGITLVVKVLRTLLGGLFRLIHLAQFSLSRQMEFNADRHAVRLAGSDAIVSSLWRIERGSLAMNQVWAHLRRLADHHHIAQDVFALQSREQAELDGALARVETPSPFVRSLAKPYRDGPEAHFVPDDASTSSMWDTHPPNRDREASAKQPYVPAPRDLRPAWVLIANAPTLREELSRRAYDDILDLRPASSTKPLPPDRIDTLIREEVAESRQADHYHGFYENRFVRPGELNPLMASVDGGAAGDIASLREAVLPWSGASLARFQARGRELDAAIELCEAVSADRKRRKGRTFTLEGKEVPVGDAPRRAELYEAQRRRRISDAERADRALFLYFYAIAGELRPELVHRYRLLLVAQQCAAHLQDHEAELRAAIAVLQEGKRLDAGAFEKVRTVLAQSAQAIRDVSKHAAPVPLPVLAQVPADLTLGQYLDRDTKRLAQLEGTGIEGSWVGDLLTQWGLYTERLQRLHFKNLGALLRLQEGLDATLYRVRGAGSGGRSARPL